MTVLCDEGVDTIVLEERKADESNGNGKLGMSMFGAECGRSSRLAARFLESPLGGYRNKELSVLPCGREGLSPLELCVES